MAPLRFRAVLLLLLTTGCLGAGGLTVPSFPPGAVRVLFIGNSLTYTNDLPAMVEAVARQAGGSAVSVASVAFANFALEDHWHEGTAPRFLREATWDFVVMQQGPSSLPENQVYLANWTTQFDPLIRSAGAKPVLYMVWPASNRPGDFPGVRTSYRNAAAAVGGLFAPAGDGWLAAWEVDATLPLYGGDGFHPSSLGTYLAALVITARITGIDPEALPDVAPPGVSASAAVVALLQRAARTALDRNP